MNIRKNFAMLTFLAIGACLLLPAFGELVDSKVYIIKRSRSATETDLVIGVTVARDERGEDVFTGIFSILPSTWEPLLKRHIPDNLNVEEVSLEQVPVPGLIQILKYRSELYSEVLPYLLAKSSPKEVAKSLPGHLLKTLTNEAKLKCSAKDLKELEELYGQEENSI